MNWKRALRFDSARFRGLYWSDWMVPMQAGWMLVVGFWLASAGGVEAAAGSDALTIYSTAKPGAIPPELYRPDPHVQQYAPPRRPAVPGYAILTNCGP